MVKAWKEVIASPQYQSLDNEQKAQAQSQYFNDVVAPQAGADAEAAKQQFFSAYPLPSSQEKQPSQPGVLSQIGNDLADAGKAVLQAGVNTVNIVPEVADALNSGVTWAASKLGAGNGTYQPAPRLELPDNLKPQTEAGKVLSDALPFLVTGPEAAAVKGAGLAERLAGGVARQFADNAAGTLATNSGPDDPQKFGSDIAVNSALGGAAGLAAKGAGAVYRGLKGELSPEAAKAVQFADDNNLPLMTSDVQPPGTFFGRSAQALGEKIPLTGTGAVRRAQQDSRNQLVQDFAQKFAQPSPQDIVQGLKSQVSRVKSAAGQRLSSVEQAMSGLGKLQPTQTLTAIDNEIANLSRLGTASDAQTINKLTTYRDELANGADFGLLRDFRTQFRQDVKGERVAWANKSEAAVNRVYRAMTEDINKSVSEHLGPQVANKYQQANTVYADQAQQVNKTRLKTILMKGELTPEVANNLLFSNKPSEVRQLYNSLDQKGRSSVRAAVIGKAFEKSDGSPDRFLNEIKRMSSQTGILFKGQDRRYLDGLTKYLDSTRRAARAGTVTPTGQELFQIATPAAVASDVVGTGGLGTGLVLSYGALARAYESKPVRNALLRLANTPAGTTAFEKNLNHARKAINAIVQGNMSGD